MRSSLIDDEDLGTAVETEIQPSRPDRTRAELCVDVADVRPGYDGEVHPLGAQLFDGAANLGSIGAAVRHGRAVPVEDDGLEATVEPGRNRLRLDDRWSAAQRRGCDGHEPSCFCKGLDNVQNREDADRALQPRTVDDDRMRRLVLVHATRRMRQRVISDQNGGWLRDLGRRARRESAVKKSARNFSVRHDPGPGSWTYHDDGVDPMRGQDACGRQTREVRTARDDSGVHHGAYTRS